MPAPQVLRLGAKDLALVLSSNLERQAGRAGRGHKSIELKSRQENKWPRRFGGGFELFYF